MDRQLVETQIQKYRALLCSNDPAQQLESTKYFHILLHVDHPPIQSLIDINAVPCFVQFLSRDENSALQLEAVKVLNTIVKNVTLDRIGTVLEADAVPIVVRLLSSPNEEIRVLSALAIGNIAGSSEAYRDIVLAADALSPLFLYFNEHASINTLRSITFAISRLYYGKGLPVQTREQTRSAIPLLTRLLSSQDTEIINNSCVALGEISNGPAYCIDTILQADTQVVQKLTEIILGSTSTKLQISALNIIGNIAANNATQAQYVIDVLPSLLWLLDHPDKEIRQVVCWTLSNITAGTSEQIQSVIDGAIFPKLFHVLKESKLKIRKEAGWVVSNALLMGTEDQAQYIINEGFTPLLCHLLQEEEVGTLFKKELIKCFDKILHISEQTRRLEVMIHIIFDSGIMDIFGKILFDENDDVYTHALNIARYCYHANMISDDPKKQLIALHYFRYRLSTDKVPSIQEMNESGIFAHLVRYLNCDVNPSPQKEAHLAFSSKEMLRAEASSVLDYIASANVEYRDVILAAGALPALLQASYNSSNISTIRKLTSAISKLFYGTPLPDINLAQTALPLLCDRLLLSEDDKTVSAACWGFYHISEGSNEYVQAISGLMKLIIPRLIELLQHSKVDIITPALLLIRVIVSKDDSTRKILLQQNIFSLILDLLDHPDDEIHDDTCWLISSITESKSREQFQEVIDAAIIPKLFQLLQSSQLGSSIRESIIPVIYDISDCGTQEQVWYLVEEGMIPLFCSLLKENDSDMDVDENMFIKNQLEEGLKNTVRAFCVDQNTERLKQVIHQSIYCDGMNIINQLLSQEDDDVDFPVQKILTDFLHRVNMTSTDLQK